MSARGGGPIRDGACRVWCACTRIFLGALACEACVSGDGGAHVNRTGRVISRLLYTSQSLLSFPLYILYTHFIRRAATVEPLVQLRGDWCFVSASLPKPSFVFAHDRRRRASSAHSHTHSHMSIGTYVRQRGPGSVVTLPHIAMSSPPPLSHVGVDDESATRKLRAMWSSSRHRLCPRSRTPRRGLQRFGNGAPLQTAALSSKT